ncbi:MAG: sulfoxide reductase heme-binding subunit YedZ [Gammaproteobacteria bacterium]|nr:sulfoxide reductase heme-binding subunit YedZ [Gammaproteobacteria bacterium]
MLVLVARIVQEFLSPGSSFGADPAKEVVDHLGEWSIRILFLTLVVSSIARLTGTPRLIRMRRMVGLWAFAYVICHFLSYFALLIGFDFVELYLSVYKRPYIIAGAVALLLLIPLAVTSTNGWQRRLRRNWARLHRLVYIIAIAAWIHLFWQERATIVESAIYGIILLLLFSERLANTIKQRRRRNQSNLSQLGS